MKPQIKFTFDEEKDIFNIWRTCNSKTHWGHDFKKDLTQNFIDICKDKELKDCKKDLKKIMKDKYKSSMIESTIKGARLSWKEIGPRYFDKLEKITGKAFPHNKVTAYLTTVSMSPYKTGKNPFFYFNMFQALTGIMRVTGHELMHIHFHYYYWNKIEKEIGFDKTGDLKEALTVLLNLEFKDLWIANDKGYPQHEELRRFIANQWEKKKDFDLLLTKCVKYLKEEK